MTHFFIETALQACLELPTVDNVWVSIEMADSFFLKTHCPGTKRVWWSKIAFIQLGEGQPEGTCWMWSRSVVTEHWEIKVSLAEQGLSASDSSEGSGAIQNECPSWGICDDSPALWTSVIHLYHRTEAGKGFRSTGFWWFLLSQGRVTRLVSGSTPTGDLCKFVKVVTVWRLN